MYQHHCGIICKLRTCNTKLPIENLGQYTHVLREIRYCPLCTSNLIGGEYHLSFECNHFIELRKQYLPRGPSYYVENPSVFKFETFMILFNTKNMPNVAAIFF